jgi:hypothetical protein
VYLPSSLVTHSSQYAAGKPPLYFQHNGHSRTIVGIERKVNKQAGGFEYNLLILDPSTRSKDLLNALESKEKWQVGNLLDSIEH